jgi:aldehyde dehydrogenase (NAD+)
MPSETILESCGFTPAELESGSMAVTTPIDGSQIASIKSHTPAEARTAIANAANAFIAWRQVPAPRRGELVRLIGEELRVNKEHLGGLVTLECGKILQEGLGEVQPSA